ncbi:MAG: motility associated factor glycosyltransferase family protein [Treponema sp.]|nr:motility associated factor glycosyltransferase family protein [Treponema sp.]
MNSIWNKNIESFRIRFPQLANIIEENIADFESGKKKSPLVLVEAKNGEATAIENSVPLHSKYNPGREAVQLFQKDSMVDSDAAVFLGFGLGYAPVEFCKKFPSTPLVLVESDTFHLLAAFSALDWGPVFSHRNVIFAVGTDISTAAGLATSFGPNVKFFSTGAQTAHDQTYFDSVKSQAAKSKQRDEINTNTLEKFSHLWLKNSCRNLHYLSEKDGVKKYFGLGENLPFVIVAAGPSLERILPKLPELKKRAVIVCVDTALKACLEAGVEPDFVVLVDPQYVCALHLEFLESPSSVLITESAAWPSVFRFPCGEIVLCSSLFPIGQYFEKRLGEKGGLGAGGSVTTTAWDFARKCGARRIYIAGMDLGFPGRQTHIRGSQFEERSHRKSTRTSTGETDGIAALLGANPKIAEDFRGKKILTDSRMSMFSWWFEKSTATASMDGQITYTLTPESLAIKGMDVANPDELLSECERLELKKEFFSRAKEKSESQKTDAPEFSEVLDSFKKNLGELESLAKRGIGLCDDGLKNPLNAGKIFARLGEIDSQILGSKAKDAAALVFPTKRQLEKLSSSLPKDGPLAPIYMSRLIYTQLLSATREYLEALG